MTPHLARYLAALIVALVALGLLLPLAVTAQSPPVPLDQPCGQGGTARRSGQAEPVTLTDAEAAAQQVRIRSDGYWWTCEAQAVMPPPREPQPCLLGRTPVEYLAWQVGRTSAAPTAPCTRASPMARRASCGPSGARRRGRSGITASTAPPA